MNPRIDKPRMFFQTEGRNVRAGGMLELQSGKYMIKSTGWQNDQYLQIEIFAVGKVRESKQMSLLKKDKYNYLTPADVRFNSDLEIWTKMHDIKKSAEMGALHNGEKYQRLAHFRKINRGQIEIKRHREFVETTKERREIRRTINVR